MFTKQHRSLRYLLSTALLTLSLASQADQPATEITELNQVANTMTEPVIAIEPTSETVTAVTEIATTNLLELDEVAGAALMQQLRQEVSALYQATVKQYADSPNVGIIKTNATDNWCPTLFRLINQITAKAGVESLTSISLGFKDWLTYSCQTGLPAANGDSKLLLGSEVFNLLNYQELIVLLAHEIGHLQRDSVGKLWWADLTLGLTATAAIIAWGRYNQVYTSPTTWGKIKDHLKFAWLSKKGLAVGIPLGLARLAIGKYLLRREEYAADEFAYQLIGQPAAQISALQKYRTAIETHYPHLLADQKIAIKFGLHHHPTPAQRAAYLQALQAADGAQA